MSKATKDSLTLFANDLGFDVKDLLILYNEGVLNWTYYDGWHAIYLCPHCHEHHVFTTYDPPPEGHEDEIYVLQYWIDNPTERRLSSLAFNSDAIFYKRSTCTF